MRRDGAPTFDEWADDIRAEIARLRWPWQRKKRDELRRTLAGGTAAQERHVENMRRYYARRTGRA